MNSSTNTEYEIFNNAIKNQKIIDIINNYETRIKDYEEKLLNIKKENELLKLLLNYNNVYKHIT